MKRSLQGPVLFWTTVKIFSSQRWERRDSFQREHITFQHSTVVIDTSLSRSVEMSSSTTQTKASQHRFQWNKPFLLCLPCGRKMTVDSCCDCSCLHIQKARAARLYFWECSKHHGGEILVALLHLLARTAWWSEGAQFVVVIMMLRLW